MAGEPRSLTVAIGCYNDAATIRSVVLQAHALRSTLAAEIEILVIDDGSRDRSAQVLEQISREIPALRVIRLPRHCGYATVVRRGLGESRSDVIFTCPGDGQIAPATAVGLWSHLESADVVIGRRRPRRDSLWRRTQSLAYRLLLAYLFGLRVRDPNSSKLIRRAVIDRLALRSRSAFIDAEILILARRQAARLTESDIPHQARSSHGASGARPGIVIPCLIEALVARFLPARWASRPPAPLPISESTTRPVC